MTKIEELAQIANHENGLGNKAVTTAVKHYKAAGDALLKIWDQLNYCEKKLWLDTNWNDSHRRAYQLMRLAKNWEGVIRGRDLNKPLSLRYALKLIQDLTKEPKTDPRSDSLNVRQLLKSHISRSMNRHIEHWTPEALWYLGKRQNRFLPTFAHLDELMEQMRADIEPIADVLYGWCPADGFMQDRELDTMTENVVSEFAGKTLSPYQKDALTEYFKFNYDDVAASRWTEYWFGEDDDVEYSTDDDEPVPPPAPSQHARKVNEDAADAAYRAQQKRKKWRTT